MAVPDHVFMGHAHGYATTVVNDVRYTISGGGVHNFLVVNVTPKDLKNTAWRQRGDTWKAATM